MSLIWRRIGVVWRRPARIIGGVKADERRNGMYVGWSGPECVEGVDEEEGIGAGGEEGWVRVGGGGPGGDGEADSEVDEIS